MNKYLFKILPINDIGLLTQFLPIVRELRNRAHNVLYGSPAQVPNRLIRLPDNESIGQAETIPCPDP
jgi:hypothetical protein